MPLNALKASWDVHAGIILGEPRREFSRRWEYTSQEADEDIKKGADPAFHSRFALLRAEAMDYYLQVSAPHINNWAEIRFIWY